MYILCIRKLRLWFPRDDIGKQSSWSILYHNFMFYSGVIVFTGALLYLLTHMTEDRMEIIVQKLAHVLVIFVGIFMQIISRWYRDEFTDVIEFVNRKTRAILDRSDSLNHRPARNSIYFRMIIVLLFCAIADFFAPVSYLIQTMSSGILYYKNVLLPFEIVPYSIEFYVVTTMQILLFYYIYSFCTFFIVIIIEPFLRLSMFYRTLASDVRTLRSEPGFCEHCEMLRLRAFLKECNEITK